MRGRSSRSEVRCRDCSRSGSPGRSPNRTCELAPHTALHGVAVRLRWFDLGPGVWDRVAPVAVAGDRWCAARLINTMSSAVIGFQDPWGPSSRGRILPRPAVPGLQPHDPLLVPWTTVGLPGNHTAPSGDPTLRSAQTEGPRSADRILAGALRITLTPFGRIQMLRRNITGFDRTTFFS